MSNTGETCLSILSHQFIKKCLKYTTLVDISWTRSKFRLFIDFFGT